MAKKTTTPFSATIEELETIVSTLEDSNTSLEDSLANFEQGVKLLRKAQNELHAAEQKVIMLTASNPDQAPSHHE